MSLIAFAEALTHSAPGAALRSASPAAVLGIQIGHVLGLILLLTSLVIVNLRLLGLGLRQQSIAEVTGATRWALWTGLVLAVGSGSLLFLSAPVHYAGNAAFAPKMVLLLAAVAVQAVLYRRVVKSAHPSRLLAHGTAVLSLTLWFGVGLFGRAIGFV